MGTAPEESPMKRLMLATAFTLLAAPAIAAEPKTYQVTGQVTGPPSAGGGHGRRGHQSSRIRWSKVSWCVVWGNMSSSTPLPGRSDGIAARSRASDSAWQLE